MTAAGNVISFPGADASSDAPDLVRVPDGTYEAAYVNHCVRDTYKGRLAVDFRILTMGEHFGKVVVAWYPVRVLDRKRRTFSVGRHSKFARDWRLVFHRGADRWDRIPMSAFRDVPVQITVRTIARDHQQKKLHEVNRYTVVDSILGRVER